MKKIVYTLIFLLTSIFTFSTLTVEVVPSKTTYGANDEIIYKFIVQANAGTTVTNASIKFPVPPETSSAQCVVDPRMGSCNLYQYNNTGGQSRDNYLIVPIVGTITSGQYIEVSVITKMNTPNDLYNQTGVPFTTHAELTTTENPLVISSNITLVATGVVDTTSSARKEIHDQNSDEYYLSDKVPGETFIYNLFLNRNRVSMGTFFKNIVITDVLPPEVEFVRSDGYGNPPTSYPNSSYWISPICLEHVVPKVSKIC